MRMRLYPIAIALPPLLAGCVPGVAEYSKSEAPNLLRVDGAASEVALAFAPGSDRLAAGEAARLDRLVANGNIRPADRVAIAASGPPALAGERAAAISTRLLRWGIVAETRPLADVPRNRAVLIVGRYAVRLPPCPNWSQAPTYDFGESFPSWYGCADATNLGLMVASPADLVDGRALGPAEGASAVNAVDRYLHDRVKEPPAETVSPFAATPGAADGGEPGAPAGAGGAPP
jgi:pilus assembly protein CpaD